jgi:hypothetical protein
MNEKDLKENLFGRENILGLLNRRVADLKDGYRQNIALLGNQFIGKSTILQEFVRNLSDEKLLPVYLEIENIDFTAFVNKYLGALLFNLTKIKTKTEYDNFEILIEEAKRFIPATVEQVKKIRHSLEKGKNLEAYRELMGLPQKIFEESGFFCVVIFDEFQNLEEFGLSFVFTELGKKIMLARSCLYIVSSSQKSRAKKILSEKLSLLFGNFDLVDVFAFDVRVSKNFVNQKLDVSMHNDYRNFLIDFTGGYPFYLDVICQELRKHSTGLVRNVSLDSMVDALAMLLFEKRGFFYQHFSLLLERVEAGGFKRNFTGTLLALANGHNKLNEISSCVAYEKGSVAQKISRLLDLNVVSKNGNFYYICDRLFNFWLIAVYQSKTRSFNYDYKAQEVSFKNLLRNSIENFCRISQKALTNRVIELLYSFDNEYFQFNGHKYRLPIFKEIQPLQMELQRKSSLETIIARNPEISWLVCLKEGVVQEEEVSSFLESVSKFKIKPDKKILIFIDDIEPNARLKALQEKMWLWNLTDINLLMNFYHRPYLVK